MGVYYTFAYYASVVAYTISDPSSSSLVPAPLATPPDHVLWAVLQLLLPGHLTQESACWAAL
jgi:hypothetical protein